MQYMYIFIIELVYVQNDELHLSSYVMICNSMTQTWKGLLPRPYALKASEFSLQLL